MSELVDTFTIIDAVATAASAFVAAKTLISIRKQRESTYKPELVIEEADINLYSSINADRKQAIEFSYEMKPIGYLSPLETITTFGLRLFNIGLGTAKKILVTIDFNIIGAISQLDKNKSKTDNFSGIINHKRLEINYESNLQASYPINSEYLNIINHILPISISNSPTFIYIPHYILELYTIFIYNYWMHSKVNNPDNFPSIDITIEYSDIGGKRMCKVYKVRFDYNGGSAKTSWLKLKVEEKNCA